MPGAGGHHGGAGGHGGHHGGPGFGGGHHHPPMGGGMRHQSPMGGGMWTRPHRRRGCCGCLLPVIGLIGILIGALFLIF